MTASNLESLEDIRTRAERRERKKTRRKVRLHGKSLGEIYQNIILKLKGKPSAKA